MRRFLLCAGVHGREKSLRWLQQVVRHRQPDGVLFAGGVLDRSRQYAAKKTPWALTRDDALFVERFLEVIGGLKVFTAIIPGGMDTPLEDFLRMGMHAELEFPGVHVVHATLTERQDVAICGVGGCLVEHEPREVDYCCSRTMAEYYLRSLWTAKQPRKILLLPVPPTGVLGGPEGSSLTNHFIDSYHPSLCVAGDRSEHRGAERIAHTVVVNPGCLSEGWAAWLDWNQNVEDQVEFLDLRDSRKTFGVDTGVCD